MPKKRHKAIQPDKVEIGTAVLSADAFFRFSKDFLSNVPVDKLGAQRYAAEHMGELVASATNLALPIELLLKALLLAHGQETPEVHDLWALFVKLPPKVRAAVEQSYDKLCADEDHSATWDLAVQV